MQYIWEAIGYDVDNPPAFFTNELKAIHFANSFYDYHLSWYQINEELWRGGNVVIGADWAVIRRELN